MEVIAIRAGLESKSFWKRSSLLRSFASASLRSVMLLKMEAKRFSPDR